MTKTAKTITIERERVATVKLMWHVLMLIICVYDATNFSFSKTINCIIVTFLFSCCNRCTRTHRMDFVQIGMRKSAQWWNHGIAKKMNTNFWERKFTHAKKRNSVNLNGVARNLLFECVLCAEFCCEQTGIKTKTDEQTRHFSSHRMDFSFRNTMNCDDVPCEYSCFSLFFFKAHSRDFTFETIRFTWFSLTYSLNNDSNFPVVAAASVCVHFANTTIHQIRTAVVVVVVLINCYYYIHCSFSLPTLSHWISFKTTQNSTDIFSDRILWSHTLHFNLIIIFQFFQLTSYRVNLSTLVQSIFLSPCV